MDSSAPFLLFSTIFFCIFACTVSYDYNTNLLSECEKSIKIINSYHDRLGMKRSLLSFWKNPYRDIENAIDTLVNCASSSNALPLEIKASSSEVLGDFGNFTNAPDFAKAKEYYSRLVSISQDTYKCGRAHFHLALLEEEQMVPNASVEKSLMHLMAAGALLYAPANMALGYKYAHGIGVAVNRQIAANFYLLACNSSVYDTEFEIVPSFSKIASVRIDSIGETKGSKKTNPDVIKFYELTSHGNIDVQIALGQNFYHKLTGNEPDYVSARRYFEMAAEENEDGLALSYLGLMALRGHGFDHPDAEAAYHYFDRAIESEDHSLAWFGLGLLYFEGSAVDRDEKEAVACWTKAADRGLSEAQYKLGSYFLKNSALGSKQSKGLILLQAALASGNQKALFEFSEYLITTRIDDPVAYLAICAERELSSIHIKAYELYERGELSQSIMFYLLASFMGYEVAHLNAAFLLKNAPGGLSGRFLSLLMKAFEYSNSADSAILLGDYYYSTASLNSDPLLYEIAVDFYLKGQKMKSAQACFNLGYCYENGMGVPKVISVCYEQNRLLARKYYNLALLYDNNAFIPVWMALFKLRLKEIFSSSPHPPHAFFLSFEKQEKRLYERVREFKWPARKVMYSYMKRAWFYIQKIIITILSILAAIIYFRNYVRLMREERNRQAANQPQQQAFRSGLNSPQTLTTTENRFGSDDAAEKQKPSPEHRLSTGLTSSEAFNELARQFQRRSTLVAKTLRENQKKVDSEDDSTIDSSPPGNDIGKREENKR